MLPGVVLMSTHVSASANLGNSAGASNEPDTAGSGHTIRSMTQCDGTPVSKKLGEYVIVPAASAQRDCPAGRQ